jgi:glycerol-3-phosphate dehydrogenase (NAD(P)+)
MNKVTIIGAGAFGFAMAWLLGRKYKQGKEIYLYDVNKEWLEYIKKTRQHPVFHRQAILDENVVVSGDLRVAVNSANLIILAVPSKFLREAILSLKTYLKEGAVLLNLAKGMEAETGRRASEIIREITDNKFTNGILSGGMIAREVTLGNPLCAEVAFADIEIAKQVGSFLSSESLRLDPTIDLLGVEYAGILKNVVAVGAGIFDGAGYQESSKSACISYLAGEAKQVALELGADEETFLPGRQAWLGDLLATCFGASRNLEFGYLLGKGYSAENVIEIMQKQNKSVEGYLTIKAMVEVINRKKIQAPLFLELNRVVHRGGSGTDFINLVMSSGLCQRQAKSS